MKKQNALFSLLVILLALFAVAALVADSDTDPPTVVWSTPGDGDKDQDPEKLNKCGMVIVFSEEIKEASISATIKDRTLKCEAEFYDNNRAAAAMLLDEELPYESEVVLIVSAEDMAGNKMEETEITFTTAAEEE